MLSESFTTSLRRLRIAFIDIDGTLTLNRGSLALSPDSITAIRVLKCVGLKVSLISGNSLPVVAGLSLYLGADIALGENGCIALFRGGEELHVCRSRPPLDLIEEIVGLGFRESWQNKFRLYDLAFYPPRLKVEEALTKAKSIAERYGFKTAWSGYALHVYPPEGGKDKGVEAVLKKFGLDWSAVLAIGDGDNDIFMLSKAGFSATLTDASELAKRAAVAVSSKTGGSGVLEVALKLSGFKDVAEAISRCSKTLSPSLL